MTEATRNALVEIDRILHDADWDASIASVPALTEGKMDSLRNAYHTFLRDDYLQILQNTLGKRSSIQEASRLMGLSEEEGNKLLNEALNRLSDFVEASTERRLVPGATSKT